MPQAIFLGKGFSEKRPNCFVPNRDKAIVISSIRFLKQKDVINTLYNHVQILQKYSASSYQPKSYPGKTNLHITICKQQNKDRKLISLKKWIMDLIAVWKQTLHNSWEGNYTGHDNGSLTPIHNGACTFFSLSFACGSEHNAQNYISRHSSGLRLNASATKIWSLTILHTVWAK